jgi:sugar O-acyltransferase (sialic acid O-acetyltransferase NeuD family)
MPKLFIFGTSGFARETRDVAYELGWDCIFVYNSADSQVKLTSNDTVISESEIDAVADEAFAIGIGNGRIRQRLVARFGGRLNFVNLIHPTASFGMEQKKIIERSRGVTICAGARFMNGIQVGDFTVFSLNSTIGHDVIVGNYVSVMPGANVSGYVEIEEFCWIGANAVINQGNENARLKIGAGTTIGSGAVVIKNCEPDSVYAGVPARKF